MTHPMILPDAMPDIHSPTLLVVCDTHHCRFINAGGRSLVMTEEVKSHEHEFTDRQGSKPSGKGGSMIGLGDINQVEDHRLKEFANTVTQRMAHLAQTQKVESIYVSAPGKFLSALNHHMTKPLQELLEETIDGNFVKESPLDVLLRFRPDLKAAADDLRDQENYSSKKHLPK